MKFIIQFKDKDLEPSKDLLRYLEEAMEKHKVLRDYKIKVTKEPFRQPLTHNPIKSKP